MGKKNNQTSVSNADRDIPTEDKRIMPETRLRVFGFIRLPLGLGVLGLHRRPMIDSICPIPF